MTSNSIKIANREIGESKPVFVVAELSSNHLHDFDIAVRTLQAAKEAGADAIKLQTYTPDTITIDVDSDYFKIDQGTLHDSKTLYELYKEAYTPWDWQPKLKKIAEEIGLICFSSPFDKTSVDFLEKMDVPAYKVASMEITDIPLIEYIASKGKPVIISTGIATLTDIRDAVDACKRMENDQIVLLKCTSAYPTGFKDVNLKNINDMKRRFNTIVGLSDHTLGISIPVAAVALGAEIVEKHFILDKKLKSPDDAVSLDPEGFAEMVKAIREVEDALGENSYQVTGEMRKNRIFSRSLFVVKNIKKGERLTEENIKSIRPGYGLPPVCAKTIIGKRARKDIARGTPLQWKLIK